MRAPLIRHVDTPCAAVTRIDIEIDRPSLSALSLRFIVTGAIGSLKIPGEAAPSRKDELWRRTCFEAFVRGGNAEAYYEFNFSPSTEWAAYRFDRYREGMANADSVDQVPIENVAGAARYELTARIDPLALDGLDGERFQFGLSAVIEAADGGKSYWALAHPPGKPDFHRQDCFTLEIARNTRT